ncbi:MipA/OmpV family protein [uncultured Cetobacterium sp.]
MSFLGIEKFSSEISDSPIVESDVLFLMGVGAKYYF